MQIKVEGKKTSGEWEGITESGIIVLFRLKPKREKEIMAWFNKQPVFEFRIKDFKSIRRFEKFKEKEKHFIELTKEAKDATV